MRPQDLTDTKDLPDEARWGFVLNCWDCFSIHQDLRSVVPAVVRKTSEWICDDGRYIDSKEEEWCRWVAEQDSAKAAAAPDAVREWSYIYATVTLVMRMFLVKSRNDSGFAEAISRKRKGFEDFVRETYGKEADWHLPLVSSGRRGSVMEQILKPL